MKWRQEANDKRASTVNGPVLQLQYNYVAIACPSLLAWYQYSGSGPTSHAHPTCRERCIPLCSHSQDVILRLSEAQATWIQSLCMVGLPLYDLGPALVSVLTRMPLRVPP